MCTSFTGDTLFQVKKSSHSKKVAKELKKKSQREKEDESKEVKKEPASPEIAVKKEPPDMDYERIKVMTPSLPILLTTIMARDL